MARYVRVGLIAATMFTLASCNSAAEKAARTQIAQETNSEFKLRSVKKFGKVICGEVSVKDGVGDYGAYKQFAVTEDGSVFIKGQYDGMTAKFADAISFDKCK